MELLEAYRLMRTSRSLDEKMLILLKQGKSFFHIGCMGHEAIQAAMACHLVKKRDWLFPYYRDLTLCLGMGESISDVLLGFLAKGSDPNSGGRQMPMHWGQKEWNIPTSSSSTGTQFLQAVGCAFASLREGKKLHDVTVVCAGDGTTSQGDFHEALNWATREKAPIIFLIENNGYAISVPVADQRPGGHVSSLAKGYDGLKLIEVDGCDFEKSWYAMKDAVAHARSGKGAVFVDASVVRLLPHSSSDNDAKYRTKKELDHDKTRDPLPAIRQLLISKRIATAKKLDELDKRIKNEIDEAADRALEAEMPERRSALLHVDSGDSLSPTEVGSLTKSEFVLVDAINRALSEEMSRNERILIFGEDVAGNKGGVFTATRELTAKFGEDRCFNSPLAESSIVGVGIGLALRGYKPVVEIQFADYIWTAMMQIRNELATIRYRSNNAFSAPMVIRVPIGGYIHGGLCHSQNIEATFAHFPGLKIALPSTAMDAFGLLKSAMRSPDPVLFLEHKALYRQNFAKSQLPEDPEWCLPFGKGIVRREGKDLTVVTYGALVQRTLEVSRQLQEEGIDTEVIDLRTICPYDWEIIEQSIKKTSRVLIVHEDCRFMGFGAELAAEIADRCFAYLDAPVKRVAAANAPIPYNWDLEEEILPQPHHIMTGIRDLVGY